MNKSIILFSLVLFVALAPFSLAASIELNSDQSVNIGDEIILDVYVDAPEIVGYEFDLLYDDSFVSFDHYEYLTSTGSDAIIDDEYQCIETVSDNGNELSGFACVNTKENGDLSGVYVKIYFTASAQGSAVFSLNNSLITNSTNVYDDPYSYPNIDQTTDFGISINNVQIIFGNPSGVPEEIIINSSINVSYAISYSEAFTDTQVIPPSNFEGVAYWLDNGIIILPLVFDGESITLTIENGNSYTLIQEVETPILNIVSESLNENVSSILFTLESNSSFDNVFGTIPFNSSYPHIWFYEWTSDFELKNLEYNIQWDNEVVSFEDISLSPTTTLFDLIGNKSCSNNWTAWSGWSSCASESQYRTRFDNNFCSYPYTGQETQSCGDNDPPGSSNGGGGGSSGDGPSEEELTDSFTYDGDVYESTIEYLGYQHHDFTVDYETVNLGIGIPYKGFTIDVSPDLADEKIMSIEFKIEINEFWMENNDIESIEIYQKNDDSWDKISSSQDDNKYTAYSDSIGLFAVVGVQRDIDENLPSQIPIKGGETEETEETEETKVNDLSDFYLPSIIGFIVLSLIITAIVVNARHPAKHGSPKQVPVTKLHMVSDYISKAKTAGMNNNKIRENLLSVGWNKELVDKAMTNSSDQKKPAA